MKNNVYNMFYGASPVIHKQAKELRQKETKAEKVLWSFLSNHQLKVKFRRQHPVSQFIVDFYCHELKLVIEVDGGIHLKKDNREYDQMRTEHLQSFNLHLMRFTNSMILENTEQVISQIRSKIQELKNRP